MLNSAEVAARAPGQCAVIIDVGLLQVLHGSLWMDNLFIAVRPTSGVESLPTLRCGSMTKTTSDHDSSAVGGNLWLTRSVLQGGQMNQLGVSFIGSNAVSIYGALAANGAG